MSTTIPVVTTADLKWRMSERTDNIEVQGMVSDLIILKHTELCEFCRSTKVYSAIANN
jgi:hypothetical protein